MVPTDSSVIPSTTITDPNLGGNWYPNSLPRAPQPSQAKPPAYVNPWHMLKDEDDWSADEYGTPFSFFEWVKARFYVQFSADMFSSEHNALCHNYHTKERPIVPGAEMKGERLWANPPYSTKAIRDSMALINECMCWGANIYALVRADPTTEWWQDSVDGKAANVYLLDKRLTFRGTGPKGRNVDVYNFPSALIVFEPFGVPCQTAYERIQLPKSATGWMSKADKKSASE